PSCRRGDRTRRVATGFAVHGRRSRPAPCAGRTSRAGVGGGASCVRNVKRNDHDVQRRRLARSAGTGEYAGMSPVVAAATFVQDSKQAAAAAPAGVPWWTAPGTAEATPTRLPSVRAD